MAADGQLRHQGRVGQGEGQNEINDDERGAAVIGGVGGKAPDVAESHRGAGGGENKT